MSDQLHVYDWLMCCASSVASIAWIPLLSDAEAARSGGFSVRPLTHCPLTMRPLSEIAGGCGSSIVTSRMWECIAAPGLQLGAAHATSCSRRVVPAGTV